PDSLRFLELLPGAPGQPLACKISEIKKSQDTSFEALSYTWGLSVFPRTITESSLNSIIQITENLFNALQALRLTHASRQLWIDAVCVNQKDTAEKNQQVAQMYDVYRRAKMVVFWLG
ncbi:heterokaryon incompatibility protein-domain-containing protein, partial [Schizothecium vesticola]